MKLNGTVAFVLIACIVSACANGTVTEDMTQREHDYALPMPFGKFFAGDVEIEGPMSIDEIEKNGLREVAHYPTVPQVPFGYQQEQWNKFKKEKIRSSDELYEFNALSETGSYAAGHAASGIAVVRDNMVVEVFATGVY